MSRTGPKKKASRVQSTQDAFITSGGSAGQRFPPRRFQKDARRVPSDLESEYLLQPAVNQCLVLAGCRFLFAFTFVADSRNRRIIDVAPREWSHFSRPGGVRDFGKAVVKPQHRRFTRLRRTLRRHARAKSSGMLRKVDERGAVGIAGRRDLDAAKLPPNQGLTAIVNRQPKIGPPVAFLWKYPLVCPTRPCQTQGRSGQIAAGFR